MPTISITIIEVKSPKLPEVVAALIHENELRPVKLTIS